MIESGRQKRLADREKRLKGAMKNVNICVSYTASQTVLDKGKEFVYVGNGAINFLTDAERNILISRIRESGWRVEVDRFIGSLKLYKPSPPNFFQRWLKSLGKC